MNHLSEYQIVLSPIQLISERIDELKNIIEKHNMLIEASTTNNEKKHHERKREWIMGLLEINEFWYERFKEDTHNGLH
jgi:hypothetical protein